MYFDLPFEELKNYLPDRPEPADFDQFWQGTLNEARQFDLKPTFEPVDWGLKTVSVYDVSFSGYGGQRIKAWLLIPKLNVEKFPCVVEYIGYGGGRSLPTDHLLWSSAGYANLVMDTRGQGSSWCPGDTPDPEPEGSSPHYPGFMTKGILSPATYYYRRLFTDAMRALETAISFPQIDEQRIAVSGASQGGGIALATAGLSPSVKALMADVPFLCHIQKACQIVDTDPYQEIVRFCRTHRDKTEVVFNTLSYFDGLNFAARAKASALFSVGLMDDICPPRTVFAAFNHYQGPKEIKVYPYNRHEGGQAFHDREKLLFLMKLWG